MNETSTYPLNNDGSLVANNGWGEADFHWNYILAVDNCAKDPEILNLHAHVDRESSDCDGRYSSSMIQPATDIRTVVDESTFRNYMIASKVSMWDANGTLTVDDENSFTWSKRTDEGGECVTVTFCTDECDDPNMYRDHRAESMGY